MSTPDFRKDMEFAYGEAKTMAPGIVRVVANNPSVFTFKGTNTYLLGTDDGLAVVDPGPGDPEHTAAILAAAGGRAVSHILITHTHRDHVDGLPQLKEATGAQIHAFGRKSAVEGAVKVSPSGTEFFDESFTPDVVVRDGDRIAGNGWAVTALHTPGHAPDHLCFAIEGQNVVLSGDHVMGWNTSVVAPPEGNMRDYLSSLEKLISRTDDELYLPGHGGRVANPTRFARAFLIHRKNREQAILESVRSGNRTIADVVAMIYKDLDPRLVRAASMSVLAHVEHLVERGLLTTDGAPRLDSELHAA